MVSRGKLIHACWKSRARTEQVTYLIFNPFYHRVQQAMPPPGRSSPQGKPIDSFPFQRSTFIDVIPFTNAVRSRCLPSMLVSSSSPSFVCSCSRSSRQSRPRIRSWSSRYMRRCCCCCCRGGFRRIRRNREHQAQQHI